MVWFSKYEVITKVHILSAGHGILSQAMEFIHFSGIWQTDKWIYVVAFWCAFVDMLWTVAAIVMA